MWHRIVAVQFALAGAGEPICKGLAHMCGGYEPRKVREAKKKRSRKNENYIQPILNSFQISRPRKKARQV
jgi:hypothetical protein